MIVNFELLAYMTWCLLLSGFGVFILECLSRSRYADTDLVLLTILILGTVFMSLQLIEYSTLLNSFNGFLIESTFYLITTLHGSHVLIGLILLIVSGSLYDITSSPSSDFAFLAMIYWHFVDAIWVLLITLLYDWTATF